MEWLSVICDEPSHAPRVVRVGVAGRASQVPGEPDVPRWGFHTDFRRRDGTQVNAHPDAPGSDAEIARTRLRHDLHCTLCGLSLVLNSPSPQLERFFTLCAAQGMSQVRLRLMVAMLS